METLVYIATLLFGLFAVLFALGAARVAGDADRQSDIIRRKFGARRLPHQRQGL